LEPNLGEPLEQTEVMELAIAVEGHPDNMVPAAMLRGDVVLQLLRLKTNRRGRREAEGQEGFWRLEELDVP